MHLVDTMVLVDLMLHCTISYHCHLSIASNVTMPTAHNHHTMGNMKCLVIYAHIISEPWLYLCADILKEFNSNVTGFSEGIGDENTPQAFFNQAVAGGKSRSVFVPCDPL